MNSFLVIRFSLTVSSCLMLCQASFFKYVAKTREHEMINNLLPDDSYKELWVEQRVDNFQNNDYAAWNQRYFVTSSYSKSNGPVFLQLGGEGTANPLWMSNGHWIEMAKKFNAMCFLLEHRFYGKSHPTKDTSTGNLGFLSSEQALADAANFISNMTETHALHGRKWIVFGGSYSGSLAIWMKLKYPHLVFGVVSASAPLNATVNFPDYNQVVKASLTSLGSSTCAGNVAMASKQITQNLLSVEGRKYLDGKFRLCEPLDIVGIDDAYFQQSLADNFAEIVQYNRDNKAFEGPVSNVTISSVCKLMDYKGMGDPLVRYAEVTSLLMKNSGVSCFDAAYAHFIQDMRNASWSAANGARQWTYQTCTEFGWFQTTDAADQPFQGFPLEYFINQCNLIFGTPKNAIFESIQRSNEFYGSLSVASVVNHVTLYNGGIDPWTSVSYTDKGSKIRMDDGATIATYYVPNTAHCAIMYPSSPNDDAILTQARLQIENTVASWLTTSTSSSSDKQTSML